MNAKIYYCKSRNFHIMKLSLEKFSCKNIFIGMTPYHIEACTFNFVVLIFVASIDYENIYTMKVSRFTVLLVVGLSTHHPSTCICK